MLISVICMAIMLWFLAKNGMFQDLSGCKSGLFVIVFAFMLIAAVCAMLISLSTASLFRNYDWASDEYVNTIPIVSLRNNIETRGNFFIGCGTVDGYEYYYTFRDYGDGSYKRMKLLSNRVKIVETDTESPKYTYDTRKWNKWIFFRDDDHGNEKLYVPKGTIIKQFKLE